MRIAMAGAHIGAERVHVCVDAMFKIGVGVEIAVGAAPLAKGNVDIQVLGHVERIITVSIANERVV